MATEGILFRSKPSPYSANTYLSPDKTQDSDNHGHSYDYSQSRDSTAQAAIGAYLVKQNYKAAINWLTASAQQDNLFAHTLLARIF